MADGENILVAAGLHKSLGKGRGRVHVLRGVDLTVRRGEFVSVMGSSGCGKSTLLHVLGLLTPTDADDASRPIGAISIDGRDVPNSERARTALRRTRIGFVFQRFNLLGVLNAADNVAISLRARGLHANGRTNALFEALGVSHVASRKPAEMSVGEQQRVAVARALAHRPALVLADEPTGNLDSENSAALLELFRTINRKEHQTIVMITHSPEASRYADRVVHMKDGKLIDSHN